jgi:hypothetical protein
MSVTLTGQEGFFQRLATVVSECNRVVAGYGSTLTTNVNAIASGFRANDQVCVDQLYSTRDQYRNVHGSYLSYLKNLAQIAAVEQVNRSAAIAPKSLAKALDVLIKQMKTDVASLNRPTVGATVTAGSSNAGNSVVVASLVNGYGDPLDMVMAETLTGVVTTDSENGATQYQETISFTGEPIKDTFDYAWPGGSGAAKTLQITDPAVDGLLTNGDFETWSGTSNNTPGSWTVVDGDYNVNVFRSVTNVIRGTYSCKLSSIGSEDTKLKQEVTLEPLTPYAVSFWAMVNTLDASGDFRIRLCDGAGTTIANEAGTDQTYTRNTNGQIGTSYANYTRFFQTPRQLPDQIFLEFGWDTTPGSTQLLYVDMLSIVKAVQLYPGGPFVAGFSKDDFSVREDSWTIAVTNDLGVGSFVRAADRLYNMRGLGLYFPTAVSESISDGLIT